MHAAVQLTKVTKAEFQRTFINVTHDPVSSTASSDEPHNAITFHSSFNTNDVHSLEPMELDPDISPSSYAGHADNGDVDIPVVGLNTPLFAIVHGFAIGSLAITILVSLCLLVYLCTCGRRQKHRRPPENPPALQSAFRVSGRHRVPFIGSSLHDQSSGAGFKSDRYKAESSVDGYMHISGTEVNGSKTSSAGVQR
jgi:hypothetical protein